MKQSLSSYTVPRSKIANFKSQLVINHVLSALAEYLISQITQKSGFSQGRPPPVSLASSPGGFLALASSLSCSSGGLNLYRDFSDADSKQRRLVGVLRYNEKSNWKQTFLYNSFMIVL